MQNRDLGDYGRYRYDSHRDHAGRKFDVMTTIIETSQLFPSTGDQRAVFSHSNQFLHLKLTADYLMQSELLQAASQAILIVVQHAILARLNDESS